MSKSEREREQESERESEREKNIPALPMAGHEPVPTLHYAMTG